MADLGCPIIVGDGVYAQVVQTMNGMWGNAQTAFDRAIHYMEDLGNFNLQLIQVGAQLTPDNNWWHYMRPLAPDAPDITFNPDYALVPQPPNVDIGGDPAFQQPPTFTDQPPTLPIRTPPGPFTGTPPDGPPVLDTVTIPDPPPIVLPDFPLLLDILPLPEAPLVVIPTFQGVRPNFNITPPVNNFSFTPAEYVDALLDKVKSRLSTMLDGGTGLPAAVVQALRDRAYQAVDVEEARTVQQRAEEFGGRGFQEPNGILARALAEVREAASDKRSNLSRDIYIEDEKIAVENLRFAVTNCISLESALLNGYVEIEKLKLESAKAVVEIAISLYNAQIALANLELQAYQTDAAVFRELIQAEMAKIELYKAELDAKRLIGELNAQLVQIYAERVKALMALVEIYKVQVEGQKAKAEVNKYRAEAFKYEVEAYAEFVKAYEYQWEAFAKQIDADTSLYRRYELATNVFAKRVEIWAGENTNLIDQKKLKISSKELDITAYRAQLERLGAIITAERDRVTALVGIYTARIEKYRADASIEATAADSNAKIFQLALAQETERVQTALKNGELQITQLVEISKIIVGKLESLADTATHLSAGALSALHVSAGINSGLSQGQSCTTSFNYSIPVPPA